MSRIPEKQRQELGELPKLIEWLMACEARQIYLRDNPDASRKSRRDSLKTRAIRIEEIIQKISDWFPENKKPYDSKLLKALSLDYLDWQVEIAVKNPSYKELRKKIQQGQYDFVSLNQHP